MLRWLIMIILLKGSMAIIAYDCSAEDSQFSVVSLVSEPSCQRNTSNIEDHGAIIQVLQPRKYDTVSYSQCLVTYEIVATHCGSWFHDNMMATQYSHVVDVSREKCESMHYNGFYDDPMFPGINVAISRNYGEYVGYVVGSNDGGDCEGGTFHSHKKNVGVLKKVAVHIQIHVKILQGAGTLNINENTITFASGYKAEYSELKAFEPQNGHTFWKKIVPEHDCDRSDVFVVYQGTARKLIDKSNSMDIKTTYVVKDVGQERDFLIEAKGNTTVCGLSAYSTSSVNLFIIESSNGVFTNKIEKNINPKNFDINLMNSLKIAHLSHDVGRQLAEMYANLMFEKCLTDSKVLMNMMALAKLDPADWGYLFFKQPGYVGTVRSEVIYLQQCSPVNVTHSEDPNCYHELPVIYNGEKKFMTPRSRILINQGSQMECSGILHNMHNINNKWYSRFHGQLITAKDPLSISIKPATAWKYQTLDDMDGGLYSRKQLDALNKVLFVPLDQYAETVNYINVINGNFEQDRSHVDPSRAYSLKDLITFKEKIAGSMWEHAESMIMSIGGFTSFLIGTFMIFKLCKFLLDTIINAIVITYAFGFFNYRILFSCWSNVVNLFLHHNNLTRRNGADTHNEAVLDEENIQVEEAQPSTSVFIKANLNERLTKASGTT